MSYDVFDHVEVRCPKLGGEVTFGYCRKLQDGLPCRRALICFELKFPADIYFQKVLRKETYVRIFTSEPENRVERLINTVAQASKRLEDK